MDEKRAYAAFGLLAGICVALAALAVYAFASSSTEQETRTVASYTETGVYTYTIAAESAPQSPLTIIGPFTASATDLTAPVPAPVVATSKARSFDFSYNYELQGEAPDVTGTVSATLELSAGPAWSEKRDLTPPTPFQGPTGSLSASLDFAQINALLQQVNTRTGASAEEYELVITPVVKIQGRVGGSSFSETFSTPLSIAYTATEITPGETLGFVEDRSVTAPFTAGREIGLFGPALAVKTLRLALTPLAALALLGAAAMGVIALRLGTPQARESAPTPESPRLQPTLVAVSSVVSGGGPRISVASLQELEKLARNNTVFVRQFGADARVYFVHDSAAIYQFAIGEVPEDWVETPSGAPAMTGATTASPAAPEAPEQIPAYLTAPNNGDEVPDGGETEQTLEPANVAPEAGAAVLDASPDDEAYSGSNGHYSPSENGHEASEYSDGDEAQDALDESGEGELEGLLDAEEDEEVAAEPESTGPAAYQTRPLYVRNREGAERARAWLKRKYSAGQIGEPVSRAAEKTETEPTAEAEAATFDMETEAATAEEMVREPALVEESIEAEAGEIEADAASTELVAEEPALSEETIEVKAGEVEAEAATVELMAEKPAPSEETFELETGELEVEAASTEPVAEEPALTEETIETEVAEIEVEATIAEPVAEEPTLREETIEVEAGEIEAEATIAEPVAEKPALSEETIEVEAAEIEVEATIAEPVAEEPALTEETIETEVADIEAEASLADAAFEVTPIEAIVEAEIEAGAATDEAPADDEITEPIWAELVGDEETEMIASPESEETAVEMETPEAEMLAPVSAPKPVETATPEDVATAAPEPAPVRPPVRRRPRSLNEQAVDFVRKKLREFLEYPPS